MSINHLIVKQSPARIELAITISQDLVVQRFEQAYIEYAAQVQVKGFRAGHAPRGMVLEQIGGRILEETLNRLLTQGYRDSLTAEKVTPVGQPTFALKKWTATADGNIQDDLEFSCATDLIPPVELGDYSHLQLTGSIDWQPLSVTDQDIDSVLSHLRRQKATAQATAKEHRLAKDNLAVISYVGKIKGVEIEQLANKHWPVVIGAGALIKDFEDQLIGLTQGEAKQFELVLPFGSTDKNLAGQLTQFNVTLEEVKTLELPALDDQFAVGFGLKNVAQLRSQIGNNLVKEQAELQHHKIESVVIDEALKLLKIDLPSVLVEEEIERMIKRVGDEARRLGLPLPIYLEKIGKSEAQLRQEFKSPAAKTVRLGFLLGEVIKREGIDIKGQTAPKQAVERLVEIAKNNSKIKNPGLAGRQEKSK